MNIFHARERSLRDAYYMLTWFSRRTADTPAVDFFHTGPSWGIIYLVLQAMFLRRFHKLPELPIGLHSSLN